MFERSIRDAEIIERWGIVRAHRRGTMGAHSHRVVIYADQIAEFIDWRGDKGALLRYAAWHDMDEVVTGDMPGPVKRRLIDPTKLAIFTKTQMTRLFPSLAWLCPGDEVAAIVKVADCLDEVLWLVIEQRMGNDMLQTVYNDSQERLFRKIETLPCRVEVRNLLRSEIEAVIDVHECNDPQVITDEVAPEF